jgi:hypothetical protein
VEPADAAAEADADAVHARYQTSVSEVREVLACLEVAGALGYLPEVTPKLRSRFDHVIGTLVNVIGGH